jgi:F-type H+-transporting ATPase subunit alpha
LTPEAFGVANQLSCLQARNAAPAINVAAVQSRTYAGEAKASPTEVSSILEQRIRGVQEESNLAETGRVLSVGYVGFRTTATANGGCREGPPYLSD